MGGCLGFDVGGWLGGGGFYGYYIFYVWVGVFVVLLAGGYFMN